MKSVLTQRRHGVWYIVSVGENGKRRFISTGTKDREQAERMLLAAGSADRWESNAMFIRRFADELIDHATGTLSALTGRG